MLMAECTCSVNTVGLRFPSPDRGRWLRTVFTVCSLRLVANTWDVETAVIRETPVHCPKMHAHTSHTCGLASFNNVATTVNHRARMEHTEHIDTYALLRYD
jgi:hypothetical protein